MLLLMEWPKIWGAWAGHITTRIQSECLYLLLKFLHSGLNLPFLPQLSWQICFFHTLMMACPGPGHVCASMPLGHTHVPAFPPGHTRVPAGATPGRTPTLTLPAGRPGRPPGSGRGDPASSGPCYHILRVHLCGEVPCPLNHLRRGTRAPGVGAQEPIQQFPAGACPPPATVPAPHRLAVAWLGAVLTPLSLDSGQPQGPLSPSGPHLQSRACQRSCV